MRQTLDQQRRYLLRVGAAFTVGAMPLSSLTHAAVASERRLSFYHLHTGERLTSTYWADGQYLPSSAAEIDFILRDFNSTNGTTHTLCH